MAAATITVGAGDWMPHGASNGRACVDDGYNSELSMRDHRALSEPHATHLRDELKKHGASVPLPPIPPGVHSWPGEDDAGIGASAPNSSAGADTFNQRFAWLVQGRWLDSMGNAIAVVQPSPSEGIKALVTPVLENQPSARHLVLPIWHDQGGSSFRPGWCCGKATLELADERRQRIVWVTKDGRRSVWSRQVAGDSGTDARHDVGNADGIDGRFPSGPAFRPGGCGAAFRSPAVQTVPGAVDDHTAAYSSSAAPDHRFMKGSNDTAPAPVNAGSCNSIRASAFGRLAEREDSESRKRGKMPVEEADDDDNGEVAFPWKLVGKEDLAGLPREPDPDCPDDVLWDGARIAALLDIRQMIGPKSEPQERLTHILMDYDLTPGPGRDYLVPDEHSELWQTLQVSEGIRRRIKARIRRIPSEAMSNHVTWRGECEVWVGHHRIDLRARTRDVETLKARWNGEPKDEPRKKYEMARILSLYSLLDNPLSLKRSGLHLGINPDLRRRCDFELFASPFNAVVPNGRYASKWPHVERWFGSIGKYPSVLSELQVGWIVCVNPPFTDAYLANVMDRLAELKLRFRLRFAIPIQEAKWRQKLAKVFPTAQLMYTYYDASSDTSLDLCHPTIFWEDPRCPQLEPGYPQVNPVVPVDQADGDPEEGKSARSSKPTQSL